MSYKKDGNYQTVCPRDCFGVCSLDVTVENDKVIKVKGNDSNHNSQGYFSQSICSCKHIPSYSELNS